MDKKEFVQWYKNFTSSAGGATLVDPEGFYEEVDLQHKKIREIIGGNYFKFSTDIGEKITIDRAAQDLYEWLDQYSPQTVKTYDITADMLKNRSVTINKKKYSIGTFLNTALDKTNKELFRFVSSKRYTEYLNTLAKALSISEPSCKYDVTISTEPHAFVMIGSYNCDQASCWRQESKRSDQDRKYIFAVTKDTFVLNIAPEDCTNQYVPDQIGKNETKCRALGFSPKDRYSLAFFNFYSSIMDTTVASYVCHNIMDVLFSKNKDAKVIQDGVSVSGRSLYSNNNHVRIETEKKFYDVPAELRGTNGVDLDYGSDDSDDYDWYDGEDGYYDDD